MYSYRSFGQYDICNKQFTDNVTSTNNISEIRYNTMETNRYIQNYIK